MHEKQQWRNSKRPTNLLCNNWAHWSYQQAFFSQLGWKQWEWGRAVFLNHKLWWSGKHADDEWRAGNDDNQQPSRPSSQLQLPAHPTASWTRTIPQAKSKPDNIIVIYNWLWLFKNTVTNFYSLKYLQTFKCSFVSHVVVKPLIYSCTWLNEFMCVKYWSEQ